MKKDKLMGVRDEKRVYPDFRIDYDSSKRVKNEISFEEAVKNPPEEHKLNDAKSRYKLKALCEGESSKNKIVEWLESNSISYEVTIISLSEEEKKAIESYGAKKGLECKEALERLERLKKLEKGIISRKEFELGRKGRGN